MSDLTNVAPADAAGVRDTPKKSDRRLSMLVALEAARLIESYYPTLPTTDAGRQRRQSFITLAARLRALSGELDELRKDKARMDWLSQPRAGGVTIGINAPGQLPAASLYLDEGTEPFDGSSLRDALDHAMAHPESCGCYLQLPKDFDMDLLLSDWE